MKSVNRSRYFLCTAGSRMQAGCTGLSLIILGMPNWAIVFSPCFFACLMRKANFARCSASRSSRFRTSLAGLCPHAMLSWTTLTPRALICSSSSSLQRMSGTDGLPTIPTKYSESARLCRHGRVRRRRRDDAFRRSKVRGPRSRQAGGETNAHGSQNPARRFRFHWPRIFLGTRRRQLIPAAHRPYATDR